VNPTYSYALLGIVVTTADSLEEHKMAVHTMCSGYLLRVEYSRSGEMVLSF
jgi:hypothetical protein